MPSTCTPNGLLIHSCSRPCQKLLSESIVEAAAPASVAAVVASGTASAAVDTDVKSPNSASQPLGENKSVSAPESTEGSKNSAGFTAPAIELTAGSTIKSTQSVSTSALAVGT